MLYHHSNGITLHAVATMASKAKNNSKLPAEFEVDDDSDDEMDDTFDDGRDRADHTPLSFFFGSVMMHM